MKRKYALTLIEIMIVIAIISLIGAVVGFNMNKVLAKGKIFRTTRAIEQVHDILMLEAVEKGVPLKNVVGRWESIVKDSGYGQKEDSLLKDAWGQKLVVELSEKEDDITVRSTHKE